MESGRDKSNRSDAHCRGVIQSPAFCCPGALKPCQDRKRSALESQRQIVARGCFRSKSRWAGLLKRRFGLGSSRWSEGTCGCIDDRFEVDEAAVAQDGKIRASNSNRMSRAMRATVRIVSARADGGAAAEVWEDWARRKEKEKEKVVDDCTERVELAESFCITRTVLLLWSGCPLGRRVASMVCKSPSGFQLLLLLIEEIYLGRPLVGRILVGPVAAGGKTMRPR